MPPLNLLASCVLSVINLIFLLGATHTRLPLWGGVLFELLRWPSVLSTLAVLVIAAVRMLDSRRKQQRPKNIRTYQDAVNFSDTVGVQGRVALSRKMERKNNYRHMERKQRDRLREDLAEADAVMLWPYALMHLLPTVLLYMIDDTSKR